MTCQVPLSSPKSVAATLIDTLSFRRPWNIEQFAADIAVSTGKPIDINPLPASLCSEITGLWVPEPHINRIYVTEDGDDRYREHVLCHELAHVVLAFNGYDTVDPSAYRAQLSRLAPNLPAEFLDQLSPARVCSARASYLSELEQSAEWMATLIQARADEMRADHLADGYGNTAYAIAKRFLTTLTGTP